jgi:hypothetical protein
MLNMIDTQDKLKNFSEQQLVTEMQQPTGSAPQFMVLGEIERRKRMRQDMQRQEGLMQPTVAQEAVSAAGVPQQGIAGLAQSLAPKTDMAQNTGVGTVQQPNQPQRMADGGVLRLAPGGSMSGGSLSAIANLKVMRPDLYEQHKDDPEMLALTAEYYLTVADDPEMTSLEAMSAPRENDLIKRMFSDPTSGQIKDQQKRDARNFGDDYALDQRSRSLINQTKARMAGNEGLFAEGAPVDYIAGNTSAGFGGSTVPFPAADTPASDLPAGLGAFTMPDETPITLPSAITGIKTPSGFGENPMPAPSIGGLPTESIASIDEESSRDAVRKFLSDGILPAIDQPVRLKAVRDMIQSAEDFQNSDTSVPPEQIYDLGPRGRLKYEEAGDEEFTSVSDRLAREAAAGEQAASDASLTAQDAAADAPILAEIARQAEARRMRRINEIPEKGYQSIAQKKKEADFAAANPFVADVIDPIIGASIDAGGLVGRTAADMFEAGVGYSNRPGVTTGEALQIPAGGISELMPPKTEVQLAAEAKKIADKVVDANKPAGGGKGGGKGSGKTSSGSGQGRIADLIADRKKQGDQDKWLALAQAGLSLMSSGDFGKAGQQGLAALMAQRAQMNKFDTDMLKLESDLALNNARIAASRSKGTRGGLTANQLLTRGNDLLKSGQTMLENAGDNADDAEEARLLIAAGRDLIRRVTGGPAAAAASSVIRTPSANQTG